MSNRLIKHGYQLTARGKVLVTQCRQIMTAVAGGDMSRFLELVEQSPEVQRILEENNQETAITIIATLLDAKPEQTPKRGSWLDAWTAHQHTQRAVQRSCSRVHRHCTHGTLRRRDVDRVIAELQKNPLEKLCVSRREYRGQHLVGIRLHFLGEDDVWHPANKGVTVGLDLWPDFVAAIQQVSVQRPRRATRERGSGRNTRAQRQQAMQPWHNQEGGAA
jgi:cobalamin biosynthesis Mg chelatase CobN